MCQPSASRISTGGSVALMGQCMEKRDASCSHQYCPSSTGYHSVFVALAVVGDFVHGNKAYLCPPPRPEISNRLLDSCVDDQKNPSIFVIFEKNQIYPADVLEYTCRMLSEVMIACLNHMNHMNHMNHT